jgi:hypothetical protein
LFLGCQLPWCHSARKTLFSLSYYKAFLWDKHSSLNVMRQSKKQLQKIFDVSDNSKKIKSSIRNWISGRREHAYVEQHKLKLEEMGSGGKLASSTELFLFFCCKHHLLILHPLLITCMLVSSLTLNLDLSENLFIISQYSASSLPIYQNPKFLWCPVYCC